MSVRCRTAHQFIPLSLTVGNRISAVLDTQLSSAAGKLAVLVLYTYYCSININWLVLAQTTGLSPTPIIYGSLSLSHWRWSHHPPTLPQKLTFQMTYSDLKQANRTLIILVSSVVPQLSAHDHPRDLRFRDPNGPSMKRWDRTADRPRDLRFRDPSGPSMKRWFRGAEVIEPPGTILFGWTKLIDIDKYVFILPIHEAKLAD